MHGKVAVGDDRGELRVQASHRSNLGGGGHVHVRLINEKKCRNDVVDFFYFHGSKRSGDGGGVHGYVCV